jgi:hypothetical protein
MSKRTADVQFANALFKKAEILVEKEGPAAPPPKQSMRANILPYPSATAEPALWPSA